MSFSDETLTAYADGELDAVTTRAVEHAMRHDAALERRVARLRAARDELYASPLQRGQRGRAGGTGRRDNVVQLAAIRAQRLAVQQAARKAQKAPWGGREWLAVLLAVVVGLLVGRFVLVYWQPVWFIEPPPSPTTVISRNGMLVAQGKLDAALSQHMGGAAPSEGDVRVGLSFLSREGGYCRTFTLVGLSQDLVGLACRANAEWRIPVLVQNMRPVPHMAGAGMSGMVGTAGTEMPTAVLEAIDQRIVGGMMDGRAELEALRRNWQR